MASRKELRDALQTVSSDLDRTMKFWMDHSRDDVHGGFFTCLRKDGSRYDDLKYGWLQGRQVWTLARAYNEVERFKTQDILNAATKGAQFLMEKCWDQDTERCYFLMQRDGHPIKLQRTIFTEVFFVMAMSEIARTGPTSVMYETYKVAAFKTMDKIAFWVREDDSELGQPKLGGESKPTSALNIPMMVCSLVNQMETCFPHMDGMKRQEYQMLQDWAIKDILRHSKRDGKIVLENVYANGDEMPGSAGRLMNPGHAIECGWFLIDCAKKLKDNDLLKRAIAHFIEAPFKLGWDNEYGGIFYFLDADENCPTQLEWDQKLWWPHNEAMISFLMAYQATGHVDHWEKFKLVLDYAIQHFVEQQHGEWFGYLHRNGEVNLDFKGGPFKGCFHVPRCLIMCEQILRSLVQDLTD